MDQFRISIKYILDSFCALEDLVQKLFDRHSNVAKIKKSQFVYVSFVCIQYLQ